MTDMTSSPVTDLVDRTAVDVDGDKVGNIFDVYVDNETNQPEWLAVNTGMFGTKVSFVPIAGASLVGDDVQIAFSKEQVKGAPKADADGELTPDEEDALYQHYGRQPAARPSTPPPARQQSGDTGHDTSGPETDDAITRSEEELDVNTTTRQAGTARIRKWIETEDVHMVVPIRREKAKLVTEPITDANRGAAMAGGDLTSEEHEVTLSEEVVDVDKRVVPKERVRLETETETEDVAVDEQIRKERIAMDNETTPDR
ncbi:MAG: DUF2382 domain-containing protein [Ilumatobacteraceae bacterium]